MIISNNWTDSTKEVIKEEIRLSKDLLNVINNNLDKLSLNDLRLLAKYILNIRMNLEELI